MHRYYIRTYPALFLSRQCRYSDRSHFQRRNDAFASLLSDFRFASATLAPRKLETKRTRRVSQYGYLYRRGPVPLKFHRTFRLSRHRPIVRTSSLTCVRATNACNRIKPASARLGGVRAVNVDFNPGTVRGLGSDMQRLYLTCTSTVSTGWGEGDV